MFSRALLLAALLLPSAAAAALPPCSGPYGSYDPGTDKRLPNGGRPASKVPFPEIKDWDSLVVTLERSGCYGDCPAYTVAIHGDGKIEFHGNAHVSVLATKPHPYRARR